MSDISQKLPPQVRPGERVGFSQVNALTKSPAEDVAELIELAGEPEAPGSTLCTL